MSGSFFGGTIVHDENDVHALADRIVKLKDGCIDLISRPCDLIGTHPLQQITSVLEERELLSI